MCKTPGTPFIMRDVIFALVAVIRKQKFHFQYLVQLIQIVGWKQGRKFSLDICNHRENLFGLQETGNSQPTRSTWQYHGNCNQQRASQSNLLLGESDRKINRKKAENCEAHVVHYGSSAHFPELGNQVFERFRIIFRISLQLNLNLWSRSLIWKGLLHLNYRAVSFSNTTLSLYPYSLYFL